MQTDRIRHVAVALCTYTVSVLKTQQCIHKEEWIIQHFFLLVEIKSFVNLTVSKICRLGVWIIQKVLVSVDGLRRTT